MTDQTDRSLQPGDITACFGTDYQSRMISWRTAWPLAPRRLKLGPSHVGMICEHLGRQLWVESTTMCGHPCVVRGQLASGAQAHRPEFRIEDYTARGGRVDIYRLQPIHQLYGNESERLTEMLIQDFVEEGLGYDLGGALLSGNWFLKWSRLMPGVDLEELFCAEMLAAVLIVLGRLPLGDPSDYNPADLMRRLVRLGVYKYSHSYTPQPPAIAPAAAITPALKLMSPGWAWAA